MRSSPLFVLSLFLVCATFAGAQSIRVVDAANGPGTDFTSLPAAVAAAVSGDVLLVRPGTYAPFWVSGKALHIFGAGPDVCVIEGPSSNGFFNDYVRIDAVPAGSSFDLAGFEVLGSNVDLSMAFLGNQCLIGLIAVRSSAGTVTLADLRVRPAPTTLSGGAGLFLDAAETHVRRCELTGGNSSSSAFHQRVCPAAISASGAVLCATDCVFTGLSSSAYGANGPASAQAGTALDAQASTAYLHSCSAIGGNAFAGGSGMFGGAGATGGSGVRARSGAFVRVSGSASDAYRGGLAHATGTISSELPGYALMADAGGTIEVHGSPTLIAATEPAGTPAVLALGAVTLGQPALPRLSTTGVAVNGGEWDATQAVTLSLTSALPNAPFVLLLDIYPGFSTPFPGLQLGELLLSGVGGFIAGGELDATGAFSVSFVPSLLAPGAANAPLHLQAAVADFGAGQWRMSNAETRVFRL